MSSSPPTTTEPASTPWYWPNQKSSLFPGILPYLFRAFRIVSFDPKHLILLFFLFLYRKTRRSRMAYLDSWKPPSYYKLLASTISTPVRTSRMCLSHHIFRLNLYSQPQKITRWRVDVIFLCSSGAKWKSIRRTSADDFTASNWLITTSNPLQSNS